MAPLYINGVLQSGFPATVNERRLVYAPIREQVLSILGSTGIIIPIGDSQHEAADRTTATTVGEEQLVFTYSEAVTAFDTPPTFLGPAQIPIIKFNGTDEEADSPDATYWSRGNGTTDSVVSWGVWINAATSGSYRRLWTKGADAEWVFDLAPNLNPRLLIRDDSAAVNPLRQADAALSFNTWHLIVATYDGSGGGTAANGITWYSDGAVVASTATNQPTYVAMENLTGLVNLGWHGTGAYYDGKMAGGPLGPFYVQAALSADAIKRLYQLGRTALGV